MTKLSGPMLQPASGNAATQAVVLLHLSETNNTPAVAERAVTSIVRRASYRGPVRAAAGRTPVPAS